jgi:hypothetical protein
MINVPPSQGEGGTLYVLLFSIYHQICINSDLMIWIASACTTQTAEIIG